VTPERDERQKRHMRMLHEFFMAEYRDDIVEYQQSMDEAAERGNEYERRMWEQRLTSAKERLAREEARQLPV
jgi:uncharacterized protein Yka (UPF0111/DUF47 family)